MNFSIGQGGTYQKRLSSPIEFRRDITLYGSSNLYPQISQEIMWESPITSAAVRALTDFIVGDGFTENGDMVVNRFDQTLNDILKFVSHEDATFNGFALHFNVNDLGLITEINVVDFTYARFGLPDENGIHHDIKINPNWENDPNKTLEKGEDITTFPIWGEEMTDEIAEQIEDFQGYILYYTPIRDQYPRVTFDAVLDSSQTNGEIQVFELGNIQNGFLGSSIYKHFGKIESEHERRTILNRLSQFKGASNANSIMLAEVPIDFDGTLLENLPANAQDALFATTNNNVVARIMANFSQPAPILGVQPPNGGIFNQEQIEDSYVYYNLRTKPRRNAITDVFNSFLQSWYLGPVSIGRIKEQKFIKTTREDAPQTEV